MFKNFLKAVESNHPSLRGVIGPAPSVVELAEAVRVNHVCHCFGQMNLGDLRSLCHRIEELGDDAIRVGDQALARDCDDLTTQAAAVIAHRAK